MKTWRRRNSRSRSLIAGSGAEFPEMFHARSGYVIEELWHGGCRVRKHFDPGSLRPGGTLSGPTMMALADFANVCRDLGD